MHMIINNQSMVPIYEQIMEQIKKAIASGELSEGSMLPSVRGLAAELRISALTVKKAYDRLEEEGLTVTVHGKGTFVTETNRELVKEQQRMMAEQELQKVVEKALRGNLAPIGRLRLLSARIEPDSEASFLFSTTAEPLPAGDGRTNRPRPAVAPVR